MAQSSRSALRKFILSLPLNGEHHLTSEVFVASHDGTRSRWHLPIISVERWGARGVAYATDGINGWTLNELTEDECAAILAVL